jgi:hypothetical protein
MGYALISPNEPRESGYRVAEVAAQSFEVAEPLFWVECPDDVFADIFWYDPVSGSFALIPEPEPIPQPVVTGAQSL